MNEKMKEDLEFARKTDEALKKIKEGKGIKMSYEKFIKELNSL